MSRTATRLCVILATALVAYGAYFIVVIKQRPREVTAQDLQGEWVQDPDFLQHAGADLDAQKREVDRWENYEFVFHGAKLTGWQLVFDAAPGDGWSQGKGVHFESEFSLAKTKKGASLKFADHAKTPAELQLAWDGPRLAAKLGPRELRLVRHTAENLRTRKLVALP